MKKRNTKSTLEEYCFGRSAISNSSTGPFANRCCRYISCAQIAKFLQWYGGIERNQPGVGIFRWEYEMCVRARLLRIHRGTWKLTLKHKVQLQRPFRNKQVTLAVSRQARPFSQ